MSCVRLLALTLLLVLAIGSHAATAQTVMVRNAPAGSTVELTWNNSSLVSAAADALGDATFTVPAPAGDHSVQIHVDVCSSTVRVGLVAFGQPTDGADAGCTRKAQWGVYIMRAITTFVVEMKDTDSNVYVSQGPPPREWVQRGEGSLRGRIPWSTPRTGLALSAGVGTGSFTNVRPASCGNVTDCDQTSLNGALALTAEYWITPWLAAFGTYFQPLDMKIEGFDPGFQFDSRLQTRVMAVGGKAGFRARATRIYGIAGFNHYSATFTTNETVNDSTFTVDGVTQTLKGGTYTAGQKITGWNWVFGGGVEAWMSKWAAIFAELHRAKITGKPDFEVDPGIASQMTTVTGGLRVRLGR